MWFLFNKWRLSILYCSILEWRYNPAGPLYLGVTLTLVCLHLLGLTSKHVWLSIIKLLAKCYSYFGRSIIYKISNIKAKVSPPTRNQMWTLLEVVFQAQSSVFRQSGGFFAPKSSYSLSRHERCIPSYMSVPHWSNSWYLLFTVCSPLRKNCPANNKSAKHCATSSWCKKPFYLITKKKCKFEEKPICIGF